MQGGEGVAVWRQAQRRDEGAGDIVRGRGKPHGEGVWSNMVRGGVGDDRVNG